MRGAGDGCCWFVEVCVLGRGGYVRRILLDQSATRANLNLADILITVIRLLEFLPTIKKAPAL